MSEPQPRIKNIWWRFVLFAPVFVALQIAFYLLGIFIQGKFDARIRLETSNDFQRLLWDAGQHQEDYLLMTLPLLTMGSFFAVYVFRKLIDRRSFTSLGFKVKGFKKDFLIGFALGFLGIGLGHVVLRLAGQLTVTGTNFDGLSLFGYFCIFIFVAFSEELVFRGYLLGNLLTRYGAWPSLLISSGLFSLMHFGNSGTTPLGLFNVGLAGILFGIYYMHRKNIWFPFALHLTWNFAQGPVFGFEVSGLKLEGFIQQNLEGPSWLTGGAFGFEGSFLCTILLVVLTFIVHRCYREVVVELPEPSPTDPPQTPESL